MPDLKEHIAAVRAADAAYLARRDLSDAGEDVQWAARRAARVALRDAIYETLGVNIDDLKELTRT